MNRDDVNEMDVTPIAEQASHWWAVLHGENVSAADYREFSEWVMRSPERVEAMLRTARLARALGSGDVRWPDVPADVLIREAKDAPADVIPFQPRPPPDAGARGGHAEPRENRSLLPRFVAIAATLLVAVAATSWFFFAGPQTYRTALGEQRSVVLEDGSLVTLNTSSQIEVKIDDSRRTVYLLGGEALFAVAHESGRPFDVVAGDATVRAVGTQFNVDLRAANTTVTVVEGKVEVLRQRTSASAAAAPRTPTFIAAAERAVITASAVSSPQRVANVDAATAWTQRRLVFERRPLGEVAEEFNRYNRRLIEIDSAGLRTEEITGVFQANDPESFVVFLSRIPGVSVRTNESGGSVITRE